MPLLPPLAAGRRVTAWSAAGRGLHAAGEAAEAKGKRHNLQLPRQELRRLLLDHCAVPVQWGRTLEAYEEDAGGVTLRFSDGATVRAAVLVAADGIRSSVRRAKVVPCAPP